LKTLSLYYITITDPHLKMKREAKKNRRRMKNPKLMEVSLYRKREDISCKNVI